MSGSECLAESQEAISFDATPLPAENQPSNSSQIPVNNPSHATSGLTIQAPQSSSSPVCHSQCSSSYRAPNLPRRNSTTTASNLVCRTSSTPSSTLSNRSSTTPALNQSRRTSTTASNQSRRISITPVPNQSRRTSITPTPSQPIHNSPIPGLNQSHRQGYISATSRSNPPRINSTAPTAPRLHQTSVNSASCQPHRHSTSTSNLPVSQSNLTTGASAIHPGDLPALLKLQQQTLEMAKKIDKRVEKLESSVTSSFAEVKKILSEQKKKLFTIKESSYELDLRSAMGELFCDSITRYPDDDKIRAAVRSVLTEDDQNKKYILVAALRNCRETLSSFRTEERRKILGISPYERSCFRSTLDLSKEMMEYMKAPERMQSVYVRHLALLRKYVRNTPTSMTEMRFHEKAKRWVTSMPPLSEQEWDALMEEDDQHPYSEFPTTDPTVQQNIEEEIVTNNSEHELQDDSYILQGGSSENRGETYEGYEEQVYSEGD